MWPRPSADARTTSRSYRREADEALISVRLTPVPSGRRALWLCQELRSSAGAAAEEMRRRTPGMMRDPVETSNGVDPREGIYGSQLSRCDRGKGRGAVVPLQRVELPRCAFRLSEGRLEAGLPASAIASNTLMELNARSQCVQSLPGLRAPVVRARRCAYPDEQAKDRIRRPLARCDRESPGPKLAH